MYMSVKKLIGKKKIEECHEYDCGVSRRKHNDRVNLWVSSCIYSDNVRSR